MSSLHSFPDRERRQEAEAPQSGGYSAARALLWQHVRCPQPAGEQAYSRQSAAILRSQVHARGKGFRCASCSKGLRRRTPQRVGGRGRGNRCLLGEWASLIFMRMVVSPIPRRGGGVNLSSIPWFGLAGLTPLRAGAGSKQALRVGKFDGRAVIGQAAVRLAPRSRLVK